MLNNNLMVNNKFVLSIFYTQ